MKVVDSSALVKYVVREDGWRNIRKHLEEGCATVELALKEVANALWKRSLSADIQHDFATKVLESIVKLKPFKVVAQDDVLLDALELANKHKVTVYDALFIALAKRLSCPLVTSDAEQAKAAEREGVETIVV